VFGTTIEGLGLGTALEAIDSLTYLISLRGAGLRGALITLMDGVADIASASDEPPSPHNCAPILIFYK
jgi:hypothetical protein